MKRIKLATVFSGIGAIEHSLDRLNIPYDLVFASDNGEIELNETEAEIKSKIAGMDNKHAKEVVDQLYLQNRKTNFVQKSYFANYDIDESRFYQDVRFIDGKEYYNKVDLFVGGLHVKVSLWWVKEVVLMIREELYFMILQDL